MQPSFCWAVRSNARPCTSQAVYTTREPQTNNMWYAARLRVVVCVTKSEFRAASIAAVIDIYAAILLMGSALKCEALYIRSLINNDGASGGQYCAYVLVPNSTCVVTKTKGQGNWGPKVGLDTL